MTKIVESFAKTPLSSVPAFVLKKTTDDTTGLTQYVSTKDGEFAPAIDQTPYKVDPDQFPWRYSSYLLIKAEEDSKSKKATAASLAKKLKEKRAANNHRNAAPRPAAPGPTPKSGGKAKPTSKPKATSC